MAIRIHKRTGSTLAAFLFALAPLTYAASPVRQSDDIATSQGILRVTPVFHGSGMLEFDGKVIHIDPCANSKVSPERSSLFISAA